MNSELEPKSKFELWLAWVLSYIEMDAGFTELEKYFSEADNPPEEMFDWWEEKRKQRKDRIRQALDKLNSEEKALLGIDDEDVLSRYDG